MVPQLHEISSRYSACEILKSPMLEYSDAIVLYYEENFEFWILDLFLFFSFYLFLFQVSGIKLDMDKGNPDFPSRYNK